MKLPKCSYRRANGNCDHPHCYALNACAAHLQAHACHRRDKGLSK